jgi:hypothetical protein
MKRSLPKRTPLLSTLKKAAPSLIGSEIPDIGEVRECMDALDLSHGRSSTNIPGKLKKELSWSDESGKDLVKYCEKVSNRSLDCYLVLAGLRLFLGAVLENGALVIGKIVCVLPLKFHAIVID